MRRRTALKGAKLAGQVGLPGQSTMIPGMPGPSPNGVRVHSVSIVPGDRHRRCAALASNSACCPSGVRINTPNG